MRVALIALLIAILAPLTATAAHALEFNPDATLDTSRIDDLRPTTTLQDVNDDIQEARRCMALSFISGAVALGMAEEDWSYADAPYVVGEWNDALLDEYLDQSDTGIQDPHVWLVTSTNDCMVAAYGNPEGA